MSNTVANKPGAPRRAVVTGASVGIGLATAKALVTHGFRVALVARNRERLEDAARTCGGNAFAIPCDVGETESVDRARVQIVKELGGAPDLVVNNAGQFRLASVEHETAEDLSSTLETNVVGAFRILKAFLPSMRAAGSGHVVTIGSIADHVAFPDNAAYAASKYALRALHTVLREETRGSGVRATLISPGPVDTPLWDVINPDARPGFTPRAKMLSASAVANAVLWVATQPAECNVDELHLSRS